jgi:restriction system protein
MLPLLRLFADGADRKLSDELDALADTLGISQADRDIMLPSGTQTQLYNRVTWAAWYLWKAGLLDRTGRGRYRITTRGRQSLTPSPSRIDLQFLSQFAEFQAFYQRTQSGADASDQASSSNASPMHAAPTQATPDEQIDASHATLRATLVDELLTRVRALHPKRFEQLVVDVLVAMGYGGSHSDAAQVVGRSGDNGIDGVIKEDRLGLDMVYIQAKRYEHDVGPAAIREFVGALGEHKATKGVFITCGGFTSGAREAAARASSRIVLIDGEQLASYMIDHEVGVAKHKTYIVRRIDNDYFGEA